MPAGGFRKPCNTTGTSTDAGYPEATFTWQVSQASCAGSRRLGARVVLTRSHQLRRRVGAVRRRARPGRQPRRRRPQAQHPRRRLLRRSARTASTSSGRPTGAPWTDDIVGPSRRLALDVRRALRERRLRRTRPTSGATASTCAATSARSTCPTCPTVMVELGNMRSARRRAGDDGAVAGGRGTPTRWSPAVRAFLRVRSVAGGRLRGPRSGRPHLGSRSRVAASRSTSHGAPTPSAKPRRHAARPRNRRPARSSSRRRRTRPCTRGRPETRARRSGR